MSFRVLTIFAVLMSTAFTQFVKEQNIYGWIDLQFEQSRPSEGNFGQPDFLDNISEFSLSRVNLYYDFKPNKKTRALIEIGYATDRYDRAGQPQYLTDVAYMPLGDTVIAIADFASLSPEMIQQITGQSISQEQLDGLGVLAQALQGQEVQASKQDEEYGGIIIERAWFDLNFNPHLNFRFGKYVNPVGIWNVDHGSPVLITARQPFQMSIVEIYPLSLTGAMFYGTHFFGDHSLDYSIHLNGGREDEFANRPQGIDDLGKGWRLKYNMDVLDGLSIGTSGYWGGMRESFFQSTPQVVLNQDQLNTLNSIYADQQLDVLEVNQFNQIIENSIDATDLENVEVVVNNSQELVVGIDFSITSHQWSLQTEYNYMMVTNELKTSQDYQKMTEMKGFYSILSYEHILTRDLTVTPYFLFEHIDFEGNKFNPIVNFSIYPLEDWQNYFIGLNFGIFNNVRIKTEVGMADINLDPNISDTPTKDIDINIMQFLTQFSMAF